MPTSSESRESVNIFQDFLTALTTLFENANLLSDVTDTADPDWLTALGDIFEAIENNTFPRYSRIEQSRVALKFYRPFQKNTVP